jgi:hypothetical protein
MVTFVGTSNTMVDTTTGRIQTKGFQHNSNVITDISGPHGRIGPTLKKYPEIAFVEGKFDRNDTTNTYTQAGYTVSASSQDSSTADRFAYQAFNEGATEHEWRSDSGSNYGGSGGIFNNTSAHYQLASTDVDGAAIPHGEWLKIKMPKKIRINSVFLKPDPGYLLRTPEDFKIYGSNDGTTWKLLITQTGLVPVDAGNSITPATTISGYYDEYAIVVTKIYNNGQPDTAIEELEFYGYEELATQGDHSVDTTFKSRFNNPQTTGVQVLVDGETGVGTNQISGGPDPSGNQSTYVTDGKYWTLNGTLTSNLAVEANTFLEGDQPHSVSVWFNSSNLEANVSNTCVFSISDQEKLDSVNLDLQSNTWHNLTYAYQGEGGSRVTYLDGRKVSEDQAEDTFGDYPPFEMTGYSQGGYVVSESSTLGNNRFAWEVFDNGSSGSQLWICDDYNSDGTTPRYTGGITSSGGGVYQGPISTNSIPITGSGSETIAGEYIQIEFPFKFKLEDIAYQREGTYWGYNRLPHSGSIVACNDGINWKTIHNWTGLTDADVGSTDGSNLAVIQAPFRSGIFAVDKNSTTYDAYKFFRIICTRIQKTNTSGDGNSYGLWSIMELELYGHRENDLVRLPDPTRVLKYPHIAMTTETTTVQGPQINPGMLGDRGYEIIYSNHGGSPQLPSRAFDGKKNSTTNPDDAWLTGANTYNTGDGALASGQTHALTIDGTSRGGSWVGMKMPRKLKLDSVVYYPRHGSGWEIYNGYVVGSNNGTSWDSLLTISAQTGWAANTPKTFTMTNNLNTYYQYFAILATHVQANNTQGRFAIQELEFYGTEEATPVPIQIGGGNIDKVANFRVYNKFIGEDQVNEIWNAQKEEFGRAKPQMVLQQGKLGIGTDAPQGSLSVADEPHNLEEFPPRAMTDYETYFEGHGVFKASASDEYTATPRLTWKAFNKSSKYIDDGWMHSVGGYTGASSGTAAGTTPTYNGTESLGGIGGDWISLEFPYKVKLNGFKITSYHVGSSFRGLNDGFLLGRSDKNSEWIRVHEITNLYAVYGVRDAPQLSAEISFTNDTYYNEYALIATSTTGENLWTAMELKYFGTREQGQSVLHDGQLTLTKNLDVPRIGPPLDADDTPRRDRLVVEYNTSTNPTFEGAVRDTSGRGNDGVFYGGASYDATEKALVFDGTDDYLQTRLDNYAGDWVHSFSFWFNGNNLSTTTRKDPIQIGPGDGLSGTSQYSAIDMYTDRVNWYFFSNDLTNNYTTINNGKWYHLCCVYEGGGLVTKRHVYLNGAEISTATTGGTDLNLAANSILSLGGDLGRNGSYFNGSISNFKLYDTALTAQEVKTLYDMGRNGKIIPRTLQIDTPVQINAPLYAPKNVINITQSFYDGAFTTTSSTLQDVYTTEWIQMRRNSEVEVDLSVLYRNDGTAWGGMYLLAFFMVDVPVGSVAANTWVAYLTPGYIMSYYQEIYEYGNTSYLPFKIPTDYKIRFKFQVRRYNSGTLFINLSHHLHFENGQFANLNQFIPMTTKRYEQGSTNNSNTYYNGHTGGTKFIIKEIAG